MPDGRMHNDYVYSNATAFGYNSVYHYRGCIGADSS